MTQLRRNGIFFVLSSPSGGGKTTIMKVVLERLEGVKYSVSYTTRPPRRGEIDGRDYHFVDQKTFQVMQQAGEFIEWAEVHGYSYGTHGQLLFANLEQGFDVMLDIDVQGAFQLREKCHDGVFIFIFPPTMAELEQRLRGRQSDQDDIILKRLDIAPSEMSAYNRYDYLVVNNDLETAVQDVISIMQAERNRTSRFKTEYLKELLQVT